MKSFYSYMLRSKPIVSLLFCYLVVLLIGLLQKLFLFSLGRGDVFFYLFNLIKNSLNASDTSFTKVLSYVMFLGSFYGVFIKAFLYVLIVFLYGAVIQFLIHIFIKRPARFSALLSIFFTTTAILYIFIFIPFIGVLLFAVSFVYNVAKELGKINGFSTLWGVVLVIAPKLIFLLIILLTASSLVNIVSLF